MKIWKQRVDELVEISPEALSEDILREICEALPDDEGDYAPYVNRTHGIIAVTHRALTESNHFCYTSMEDGACALESIGSSTAEHIVVPTHAPTGERCAAVAEYAFVCDSSVKSVTFLGSVTISDAAFLYCNGLKQVTVCGGLAHLSKQSFGDCTVLTDFDAPAARVELGDSAFSGCTSLEHFSARLVSSLEESAFFECESLTDFAAVLDCGKRIPTNAFRGCKRLTAIRLPEGIEIIESGAFEGCESLTVMPLSESLTVIGQSAFYGCLSLTEIVVPNSVTDIGDSAFSRCTGLKHLRVPHGAGRDACLLDDEDIRRFTDFYTLYNPDGWVSYNADSYTSVEFCKSDT